jgi:alpha-1,3/alpha-1,6-mannosyltransferase
LGRYERKKNIALAIDALNYLKNALKKMPKSRKDVSTGPRILLVVAGGYDERVDENVEYLEELKTHASSFGFKLTAPSVAADSDAPSDAPIDSPSFNMHRRAVDLPDIVFRVSISGSEREALLSIATALLYTPDKEHFGIVPLEAMYAGTPVIAVASGGPLETVLDGVTGFLCQQVTTTLFPRSAGVMLCVRACAPAAVRGVCEDPFVTLTDLFFARSFVSFSSSSIFANLRVLSSPSLSLS